ncbi:MAG: D-xylose ABC transporter ATP-binding protein [Phycisphaerae bacterium]|nr:D-xylose ABC transporter ATP-binding protein [Phycisphaerae bacterium]
MILQARNIVKRYPGVLALDRVDLDVTAGEIVAVVGENGAGKSTLMRILAGDVAPDEGRLLVDGEAIRFGSPRDAIDAGVVLIHQELSLADNLDVGANILLGREPRTGPFLRRAEATTRATAALRAAGLDLEPSRSVADLGMGTRQLVEIAKALSTEARMLIMDEPTSSLTAAEADLLFETIERLRDEGTAIVYISHRLGEIERLADRVVVLRDGRFVRSFERAEVTRERLVESMVGRDLDADAGLRADVVLPPGPPRLEIRGLRTTRHPAHAVDLKIRSGEIIALAGLVGAGRTELLRAIFGIDPRASGEILVDGEPTRIRQPSDAARAGIALVPEDRKADGLLLDESIAENLVLPGLARTATGGILRRRPAERGLAETLLGRMGVRPAIPDLPAGGLSGGNQQKVAVGRWVGCEPNVFLLDEPTRGVDVGAKAEIHALLDRIARSGAAVIAASSEMEELLAVSDRVVVMHEGRIAGELTRHEATESAIMRLATGGVGSGDVRRSETAS